MKDDALSLYFSVLDVYFVATEDNGNVLTYAHQVAMPVGHILVGNSRGDIKHDDSALSCGGSILGF